MRDDGSDTTCFRQPAAKFFRACRAFDVAKSNILNVTHEFICENIPWFEDDIQAKTELCTYDAANFALFAAIHPRFLKFFCREKCTALMITAISGTHILPLTCVRTAIFDNFYSTLI